MDLYEGPAEILLNGRLLAQATKASTDIKGNNNPVTTMIGGLVGKSDGPTTSQLAIESAMPRKGMEADFRTLVIEKRICTVVVKSANQRVQFIGWFEDTSWSNAPDAASFTSATFMAGKPKILGA